MTESKEAKMVEELYKPAWEDEKLPSNWPQKVVNKIREIEGWFPLSYSTYGHSLLLQKAVGEVMLPIELKGKEEPKDLDNDELLSQWFDLIIKNSLKYHKPEFEVKIFFYMYRDGAFNHLYEPHKENDDSFWNEFYNNPTREELINCVWRTLTTDNEEIN